MALITQTVTDSPSVTDVLSASLAVSRTVASDSVVTNDAVSGTKIESLSISNARALSSVRVRIDFSAPALVNDALTDPSSYTFANLTPGSVGVVPFGVRLPPGQVSPSYVEVDVSEHTDGSLYEVSLSSALRGAAGEVGIPTPFTYIGEGSSPLVTLVLATSPTEAKVYFSSESMLNNSAIRDVDRYEWDNGLVTVAVKTVVGNVVTLRTTPQIPGTLYTLTVLGEIFGELFIDDIPLVIDDIPLVIS